MASFSKNLGLLALGMWLGMAVFFGAVVAPTVFNPEVAAGLSREMAGSITNAVLRRLYLLSHATLGLAAFALLLAWLRDAKGSTAPRRAFFLCLLALAINVASDLWISPRMNRIRFDMRNSRGDPVALKADFDRWHNSATVLYKLGVGAGLVGALFLLPAGGAPKPKKTAK